MATRVDQRRAAIRAERLFFTALALAMLLFMLWGFSSSFYLRAFSPPEVPSYLDPPLRGERWLFIVHGLVFTAWVTLVAVQAWLIGGKRLRLHKAIGEKAYILYGLMLATAYPVAFYGAIHGFHVPGVDAIAFSALPLIGISVFAVLAWKGLNERRDPQRHKRLMIYATIGILGAAGGRLAGLYGINPPVLPVLPFLVMMAGWDLVTLHRLHRTTLTAGGTTAAALLLTVPFGMTPLWQVPMRALIG